MEVSTELSVVNATHASPGPSFSKRFNSSAAKCCASAAEPPLPQHRILPSLATQSKKTCAPSVMGFASASLTFSLSSALSLKCLMMRLLMSMWVVACLMNDDISLKKVFGTAGNQNCRANSLSGRREGLCGRGGPPPPKNFLHNRGG